MTPPGPLNPVEPTWPRKPPGERRERAPARQPPPEDDRVAPGPAGERESGPEPRPVPGRIVDDYA